MPKLLSACCALVLVGSFSSAASAYVGELSKDSPADQVEGLAPQADRNRAYRTMIDWLGSAKPETPMSVEVLRAYKLLRNSDEQVLMVTHQQFLDRVLKELRQKLSATQLRKIDGYRVRVTAAFDGIARVDRANRSVLIPVDFLHDVWTAAMAIEEMGSMPPSRIGEGMMYIAVRVNPRFRAQREGQTFLAQGLAKAMTGEYWQVSREKWNDAIWGAYAATRGAALHQALHELCHVLSEHKDYGDISSRRAVEQEREADECALKLMPDFQKEFYNPGGALLVMVYRSFDAEGNAITSRTHPPAICRVVSMTGVFPQTRELRGQISEAINSLLPGADNMQMLKETQKMISACGQ